MRMRITLRVHEVWEAIETKTASIKKNDLALALLFQSIPETLILQVGELDKAKQVWEAIKARYVGAERVKEARLQTLMIEFNRLKMKETESIDDFGGKLSELASKSSALGVNIEEAKLVKKFLLSLPRKKYIHIVASIEQVLDLHKTNFEDIIGRLKAYEERILDEEDGEEDQAKLMYTNNDGQSGQTNRDQSSRSHSSDNSNYYQGDSSRGRGRGGGKRPYNNRGRGRGRYNGGRGYNEGYNRGRGYAERDASKITCYRCDKVGHFVVQCPELLLKLQETHEADNTDTQEADELMMHEVVFLNEKNVLPK
ncbi:uncharacterized protein LOC111209030 [Brassica napus]|uniref:uncharacterized protein LOC106309112 n=1 Tax=Brassica oleracea var. oleracea TaxID=109376 RepID=UPI0006A6FD0A|nr:PREDICTED: uncharacterized protein LOC106309112 [Brassica oleracea var. oleracea]XP_022564469.1 uncharacterized protein LOC111209030 [Brassica napus]